MKRKLCICLSTLLVLSTLTGCSMDEFKQKLPWNKGNVQVDIETNEETHSITLNNGAEFESGTEVQYSDIAFLSDEDTANLVSVTFAWSDQDGLHTSTSSFTVPDVEETKEVSIDTEFSFMDGTTWSGTVSIIAKPGNKITYPEPLATNLRDKEWYSQDLGGAVVSTTYPNNTTVASTSLIASYPYYSGDNYIWFNTMNQNDLDDLKKGPEDIFYVNSINAESENAEDKQTEEQYEALTQFATTVRERLIMPGGVDPTDYVIYDSDGNASKVSRVYFILDGQLINESPKKITAAYTVTDSTGNTIAIVPKTGVTDFDYTLFIDDENLDFEYDFKASAEDNLTAFSETNYLHSWTETVTHNAELLDDCIEDLVSNVFLGEVIKVEQQSSGEIVDAPSDVQIDVGSGDTESAASSDELYQTKPTYQSKHPGIYQWPENDIKYRRWDYVINNETGFEGIIIMPDGTIIRSKDKDSEYEFKGGSYVSNGSGDGTSSGKSNAETYEIVSAYGTYKLTSEGFKDMLFEKNLSTSGRLVFTYNNTRFYIETGRASTINNYLANSIYSMDNFNKGVFEVQEVTERTKTDYGSITDYVVQYTTKSNESKKSAYMSVYNLNNDYLICYSEELIDNLTIMHDLLRGMVTVE